MAHILFNKLKESMSSVLPIALIVIILYITPLVNLTPLELLVFGICTVFLIIGIGLFNLGADMAMTPMGEHVGAGLSQTRRLRLLLSVGFIMGLLITVAEPDLSVLASQVSDMVEPNTLIFIVGFGVGLFLLTALMKIVFRISLSALLLFFYMTMFGLTAYLLLESRTDFLALAYDSGGVTTGPITVPFIMALGVGIANTIGGRNAAENSFGLIALCSVGPILAIQMLGIASSGSVQYSVPEYAVENNLGPALTGIVLSVIREVGTALGMVALSFLILQIFVLKLPKRKLLQIGVGILYTFFGLVIFLCAVNVGYMPVGYKIGVQLADNMPAIIIGFGFLIGLVVVLAEPAVHVLNNQVEDVTGGTVTRRSMTIALSVGVGISIALSMVRILYDFSILYYLIPGYLVSLGLSFFVPPIYTAIAFDSGGVASGPLTSGFILPLAVGVCCTVQGEAKVLSDAFGIVAMVAMTPLITIQLLGFRAIVTRTVRRKIAMRRILGSDDEQIIEFM